MEYNAQSIQTLDFRTAIRTRVAMYMGSADNMGVLQCVREIITNSIDEATMGFGDKIIVELFENNRVKISDFGRGCPFGKRDDGTEALQAIYTMAHSGAKFNDKVFQNVAGQNGIGAKGVALSSSHFQVWSYREGRGATMSLRDGNIEKYEEFDLLPEDTSHGTQVEFIPSQEVYNLEPINIDFEEVKKMCHDWSFLSKTVQFVLINHITGEKVIYHSKNGLVDLLIERGDKVLHKKPLSIIVKENGMEAEIVMQWTADAHETSYTFTNGLENAEGGTSLTGIKTALTNFFKKRMGGSSNPDLVKHGLVYAVACKVPNPSFANQTKTKVNNPELRGLCQKATTQMLEAFESEKPEEFKKILDALAKQAKADLAAEKAKMAVLQSNKDIEKNIKRKVFASDKLKDARKLGQDSVLLIVEGDSAMNSLAQARDPNKYGLLAIRGKIINALSNTDDKIMSNEEVKLILSALGVTPNNYKSSKLRYGKIGIASDADKDGNHIALLILSLFAKLLPEMLEEGRVFRLESPTHIVKSANKNYYFFSHKDFNERTINGDVTLCKGLGELNAEHVKASMFGENQRRSYFIWDEDANAKLLDFMGEDVEPRREFLFTHVDFSEVQE